MTQDEYLTLAIGQAIQRAHHRCAPGQADGAMFRRRVAPSRRLDWQRLERDPAAAGALPGALPIDAGVHQDACEPDLEWMLGPIGAETGERLDEGILNGLVGVGPVAQVEKRDA